MPSPLGHVWGGIATAWAADLIPGNRAGRTAPADAPFFERAGGALTLLCAGLAAIPDADLLFGIHRTATHSITAVLLVTIVSAAVTGQVTTRVSARRIGLMCGTAWASHLFLDWLAVDPSPPFGIQLLWPFSRRWFVSGLDLFPRTERYRVWSVAAIRTNLNAFARETAILLPILIVLWLVRIKALARLTAKLTRGDHAA